MFRTQKFPQYNFPFCRPQNNVCENVLCWAPCIYGQRDMYFFKQFCIQINRSILGKYMGSIYTQQPVGLHATLQCPPMRTHAFTYIYALDRMANGDVLNFSFTLLDNIHMCGCAYVVHTQKCVFKVRHSSRRETHY